MENLQKALNLTLEALRTMQFSHTPEIFERHFRNLKVAELEDGLLVIIAPDDQVRTLNTRFRGMILSWMQSTSESMQDTQVTEILFVTASEYAEAVAERNASAATPDNVTPLPEEVSSVTLDIPEPEEDKKPIQSDSTLSFALSSALQRLKSVHYGKSPTYEKHFAGVKVGHLDSEGKLILVARDQNVEVLNARWAQAILFYLQEDKVDVHQVVFVRASKYATPDIPSPVVEAVSSVTEAAPGEDASLEIEMTWSGNYDQVVQPERVITIPRYFLRHISRMGAENAWLYIGFRQAAYQAGLHREVKRVDISSRQISRWAGIHPATFWRRFVKEDTWKALNGFVVKVRSGEWTQNNQDGRPHQAPNRYRVSMTVPLTPQDACSLRGHLIDLAEAHGIEAAVEHVLTVPAEELLIPAGDVSGNCDPMTVYQLVTSLGGSSKAASDLQAHIINYHDVIVLTQFFVETWLPRLSEAAAWMIVWMRDTCDPYGNFRASVQDIMKLTGVSRERTVRDWLRNEAVALFVKDSPESKKDKARGRRAKRSFLIRQDEPLESELVADATHRSDSDANQLVAVAKDELVAVATHRKNGEKGQLVANATHRKVPKSGQLVAVATHRRGDSPINWSLLRYQLVGNARVLAVCVKTSSIKLIKESTTSLNLINSINKRDAENFENGNDASPDGSPEGDTQLEAVEGTEKDFSPDLEQQPEGEEFQEPGDTPADPDDSSDLEEQLEVVEEQEERIDPQALFHDILKRASVSLKIQRHFKDKPFYPFLAWLIYGASREKIADPVAFAISRYETGLPGSADAVELALDPDDLLADLEDYMNRWDHWNMSRKLRRLFGEENGKRVELLANILGVERNDRYESLG